MANLSLATLCVSVRANARDQHMHGTALRRSDTGWPCVPRPRQAGAPTRSNHTPATDDLEVR
jgi:hypothetical protein